MQAILDTEPAQGQVGCQLIPECSLLQVSADMGNHFSEVLAAQDVALYGGLCALASFDRPELKRHVIDNLAFNEFLELCPEVLTSRVGLLLDRACLPDAVEHPAQALGATIAALPRHTYASGDVKVDRISSGSVHLHAGAAQGCPRLAMQPNWQELVALLKQLCFGTFPSVSCAWCQYHAVHSASLGACTLESVALTAVTRSQVRELIFDFNEARYATCLARLARLTPQLRLDRMMCGHITQLSEAIRSKAIVQYTQPYQTVHLPNMAAAFSTDAT